MSIPILGLLIGTAAGAVVGLFSVTYFEVSGLLAQFCLMGSAVLVGQLLGATIGAALGKPHE
jgi:hypothetical protein